jgi:hypothetical protein
MRSAVLAVVSAMLLLVLSGCGDHAGEQQSGTSTAQEHADVPVEPRGHNDVEAELPSPPPPPVTGAAADAAAAAAAEQVMAAFARPGVDAATWFTDLAPLLTPSAQTAYLGRVGAEVPSRAVTGAPRLTESPSAYLAYATVPTDVGEYRVLLVREGEGSPWLAETITPPSGVR